VRREEPAKAAQPARGYSPKLGLGVLALLCLVSLLVFIHTVSFEFVYDDSRQILRNSWIRDWSKVGQFFTTDVWAFSRVNEGSNYYRPLHMFVHAIGYHLSKFKPVGYHAINILLHIISTLLVARIGLQLTREKSLAIAAGLLFALHPIHTESVTWIAGVTDPLCAVFFFGALSLYLKDSSSPESRWTLAGILLLFMGALFSKEMAFVFPLVAVWADWSLKRTFRWKRYALFLGCFAVYGFLRYSALGLFNLEHGILDLSLAERFMSSVVLLAVDIVKLFIPFGISAYHLFYPTQSPVDIRFLLSAAALILVAILAWRQRKNRTIVFLWGSAFLMLLPLMNITGIGDDTVYADRYLYIPSLASCLLIPIFVQNAWRFRPPKSPFLRKFALWISLGPVFLIYGTMAVQTSFLWRDDFTLYSKTLEQDPEIRTFAVLLGEQYIKAGNYEKAEPLFLEVIKQSESNPKRNRKALSMSYTALGGLYFYQKRYDKAKANYEKAYAVNPDEAIVIQNLGMISLVQRDYPAAEKYLRAALAMNPRNELAYNNLANMYLSLNQYELAEKNAQKAIEIFPEFGRAHINLAQAYAGLGMKDKARAEYRRAAELEPAQKAAIDAALKQLGE
jgi:tetratricopeptide (TPR) repeat protein